MLSLSKPFLPYRMPSHFTEKLRSPERQVVPLSPMESLYPAWPDWGLVVLPGR